MKYPIGTQTFETLIENGCAYVDKTAYIYSMAQNGARYYFLSRPRRFGKSLLLSTIEAYFQGKRHLFKGLALYDLEKDWEAYPVIKFDLNNGLYLESDGVKRHIDFMLEEQEKAFGIEGNSGEFGERLERLIKAVSAKAGKPVVVLVDEYDKPLLEAIGEESLQKTYRAQLRSFYSTLKTCDPYIRFAMLTGVTKYGHLSIFSGLNNLCDISMDIRFAAICGMTREEINAAFAEPLKGMAQAYGIGLDELMRKFAHFYDGYRFTKADIKIFNPFSVISALNKQEIENYWFATGTPSYLAKLLQRHDYELWRLENEELAAKDLWNINDDDSNPVPVIYQSGYLTIKDYDEIFGLYTLGFPNQEVRQGFADFLLPYYAKTSNTSLNEISGFVRAISSGDLDAFFTRLKSLIAAIPYPEQKGFNYERHYQNILFIVFTLLGYYVASECHISTGRIDLVVKTKRSIYVMEFKVDSTAQEAVNQIREKGYAAPFVSDGREVVLVGVNFSSKDRNIDHWIVES